MAYFSNGTEGECYRESYCHQCRHYIPGDGPECPVWTAHWLYSYGQAGDVKTILSLLIPEVDATFKDGLSYKVADQCAMFIAKPPEAPHV